MKDFANRGSRRRGSRRASAERESFEFFFGTEEGEVGPPQGAGRRDHKTAQLCRQVFRALSLALAECADDVVRELTVVGVEPAPDASRLLVWVALSSSVAPVEGVAAGVLARLGQAHSFLRREVASAITRKRAPELTFMIAPSAPAAAGEGDHE